MASRRDFLKAAAASAGGALLAGHGLATRAQSARREVRLTAGGLPLSMSMHTACFRKSLTLSPVHRSTGISSPRGKCWGPGDWRR